MARRFLTAMLLALLVLPAAAGAAAAQSRPRTAAEAIGLSSTAGYSGHMVSGGWLPVEVVIDPPRALRGTLTVRSNGPGGPIAARQEVEVAPGSPKAYRFLLPRGTPLVRFTEAGEDPVELRMRATTRANAYLAGVLGAIPAEPPPLRSEPAGISGTWVAVDPAWLEVSPAALAPLGVLVAERESLEGLSPRALTNLAAGVAAGTDLVVVGGGGPLGELPVPDLAGSAAAWSLRADHIDPAMGSELVATVAPFGEGRLIASAVAPGDEGLGRSGALWSVLAQPSGARQSPGSPYSVEQLGHSLGRLLTQGATGGVPALPWLAAFIVAYVLVAGPLNALILGRLRRRELAWVTVPLVTVLFTVSAFTSVSGARPKVGLTGSAISWVEGVATEWALVGARAPREADHEIVLAGAEWTVQPMGQQGAGATVDTDDGATRVRFHLATLQLGGVLAHRSVAAPPPLRVVARAEAERMVVTVTNTSTSDVSGVNVRAAGSRRRIGILRPGQETAVEIPAMRLPVLPPWRDVFEGMPSGPPATLEALLRVGPLDGSPGLVWATGHVGGAAEPVRVDGQAAESQGRAIAVGVIPERSGPGVSPFTVARELVAPVNANRLGPDAVEGVNEAFLRLRLHPGPLPAQLVSDLTRVGVNQGLPEAEVWVWDPAARSWLSHAQAFPGGVADGARLVSATGELWVRLSGHGQPLEFSGRSISGPGGAS